MIRSSHRPAATILAAALVLIVQACSATGSVVVLPMPATDMASTASNAPQTAVFAGGCFWGIEAVFRHVKGVSSAISGYAGGSVKSPSYETVSGGSTGHAESVKVIYDPAQVSYGALLNVFFSVAHDPTQLNRQGPDRGTQYRSAIFTTSDEQSRGARAYIGQLDRGKAFARPIVTEVAPLSAFYDAEPWHQNYAALHPTQPYIAINDLPKVARLREQFPGLFASK